MSAVISIRSCRHPDRPLPGLCAIARGRNLTCRHATKHDVWAVTRYDDIKAVFADHINFSNAGGAGIANHFKNKPWRQPSIIREADPPMHTRTRKVLARIMSPGAMRRLEECLQGQGSNTGRRPGRQNRFDAVRDLAEVFPLSVFPDALGIDQDGRENLLTYGAMVFARGSAPKTITET